MLEDDQVMIEQVKKPADEQDEGITDAKIGDNNTSFKYWNKNKYKFKQAKSKFGIWKLYIEWWV